MNQLLANLKSVMAELKAGNWKQVFVDHGEKLVVATTGLLSLLAIVFAPWKPYDRDPREFLQKVTQGQAALQASVWPDEERQKYDEIIDGNEKIARLRADVPIARYEYSTPWFHPLYPPKAKRGEPKYLPVQDLIADASSVIIELPPEGTQPQLAGTPGTPGTPAPGTPGTPAVPGLVPGAIAPPSPIAPPAAAPSPVAPRGATAGSPAGLPGSPILGGSSPTGTPSPIAGDDTSELFTVDPESDAQESMTEAYPGSGEFGSGYGIGTSGVKINAEGRFFVAVRGIVPLREQAQEFQKALRLETITEAYNELEYIDFVLERQKAVPGDDPWSGKWEKVDIEVALDLLDKVDFDNDVVSLQLTDPAFTMPLPARLAGSWNYWGSHPKIGELTREQMEAQAKLTERLLQMAEELKEASGVVEKRGFASKVRNARQAFQSVATPQQQQLINEIAREMGIKTGVSNLFGASSLAGSILLFRYLDFDVEPGNAYRYRVKLLLRNPNYKRPLEELEDPGLATGEYRETPWSNPTNPVVVPDDEHLYLTKVEPPRNGRPAAAQIEVFRWLEDAGTTVQAVLDKLQPGDFIAALLKDGPGGKKVGGVTTEVLRPAQQTLEEETIELVTDEFLLDVAPAPQLSETLHADVLPDNPRDRNTPAQEALVLDENGQLVALDEPTHRQLAKTAEQQLEAMLKPWRAIVRKSQPAAAETEESGLSELELYGGSMTEGGGSSAAGFQPSSRRGRRSRRPSPLKRRE